MISKYGISKWKVHKMECCLKGTWRASVMPNSILFNKEIASLGYMSTADYYLKVRVN